MTSYAYLSITNKRQTGNQDDQYQRVNFKGMGGIDQSRLNEKMDV